MCGTLRKKDSAASEARHEHEAGVAAKGIQHELASRKSSWANLVEAGAETEEEAASAEGSRPLLTTEYDVFECDAFTPDMGRWVRLMPEADFIPT